MAEASISVDQDQFICSVCLDLLKDPVSLSCGHSFCKVCINGCWDQEDQKDVYSCPQCRDTFTPRPVLRRNNMLAEVVEKLKKKTEVQAASPDHCYTGPGDVECDFCTGRKHKAVKSCLVCVASFCETHLKPHYQVPSWKKHKLVEASGNLQEKICSEHDKVLEIFCRSDQSFICYLCMTDKHIHDTVTAAAEKTEKGSVLQEEQLKFQQRLQEKQKKVQELKQTVNTIKLSTQTAVEDNERIFTELISFMEKKRSEVTEMIRAQEKAELSRAERLLEQLEQEIDDLQRRVTEMEKLSHTHDHIHFLQRMRKSFFDLKKRLEEICQEEFIKVPEDAAELQIILPSEPKSRDDFLHYFCDLTLDPNTVNHHLVLSEKTRAASSSERKQRYPFHPERFDCYSQVLCKESVCGRCYWEVEWSSEGCVEISVSYKNIRRKGLGDKCVFGLNKQSWSLECSSSSLSFYHNNIKTEFGVPSPSRIGVYVDHSAGALSFYSISDTMKLLHRVHTTFTQPLYAGFWLPCYGSTVRFK
ncbi:E3 ubiquitin/ISG15 ligase TRIM25-like isoform X2 [Tachysurus vachellii]|uniref:E3 ubiquitin/ISG15 ligase TRIM25-like isoform X2 n=1 Tax=Tachysurus vachellii TaxID=175792 RepID=UPI00296AE01B|nr:E3 ubiquitin/ISG15 ligase TRIM25-like isoform X2 [Tachysurus vachellii]